MAPGMLSPTRSSAWGRGRQSRLGSVYKQADSERRASMRHVGRGARSTGGGGTKAGTMRRRGVSRHEAEGSLHECTYFDVVLDATDGVGIEIEFWEGDCVITGFEIDGAAHVEGSLEFGDVIQYVDGIPCRQGV